MPLATVLSRSQHAMDAPEVRVEVDVSGGLPTFSIVGLPEAAVRESKDRVRAALTNCGFVFPYGRITVNLAPADLPKEGGRFDLPIAVGILLASEQLPAAPFATLELYGELSLSGELQPIRGALPTVLQATRARRAALVPHANLEEAAVLRGATLYGARHLLEVCGHARGLRPLIAATSRAPAVAAWQGDDLADVHGQALARRALEVAAAGEHGLLLIGPPGSGKSMLAHRLPGLLPPLEEPQALECAAVHSLSGRALRPEAWRRPPFRCPHHTASAIALVGGGSSLRPGEISLAHHGVLFLDELPEFSRQVLEVLREPLETGTVCISRAARQAEYPARFQFLAAMNPCPCGYLGDASQRCHCPPERVAAYRARVSGPLLDRIDLQIDVQRVPAAQLHAGLRGEGTAEVAARVATVRRLQLERQGDTNARLQADGLARFCVLDADANRLLEQATRRFALSARAHTRVRRIARSIADLAGCRDIATAHLAEAVSLRCLGRGVAAPS